MTPLRRTWIIVATSMIVLAVAMSIGRFAFTPLLPFMQRDLGVSLTEGGWLASANYIGYLAGALSCMFIRLRPETMIRAGLLLTSLLTLGMGATADFVSWIVLRSLAGIASAWVLVFGSAWLLKQLESTGRSSLGNLSFAGVGIGIFVTGLLTMAFTHAQWSAAAGWQFFGVMALLLTVAVWPVLDSQAHATQRAFSHHASLRRLRWSKQVVMLVLCYGAAGFGYIIAGTFLPLIARETLHSPEWLALFWPLFGLAVAVVGGALTLLPASVSNHRVLIACYVVQGVGNLALAWLPGFIGLAVGTALMGSVFTTIVQYTMREARHLAQENASVLIGALTSAYGLGQIVGPLVASYLTRELGSFTPSLLLGAAAMFGGALALRAMRNRKLETPISHVVRPGSL